MKLFNESPPANSTEAARESTRSTKPPKLTVNAAFLEEVKAIHSELWELLAHTRQMCQEFEPAAQWQSQLAENMAQLRDLFAMQFSLEEGLGYFSEPAVVETSISARAAALRDDHRYLYEEISRISDWLDDLRYHGGLPGKMKEIQIRFESFHDQIQTHEQKEQELIYDSYCNDLGTGD